MLLKIWLGFAQPSLITTISDNTHIIQIKTKLIILKQCNVKKFLGTKIGTLDHANMYIEVRKKIVSQREATAGTLNLTTERFSQESIL